MLDERKKITVRVAENDAKTINENAKNAGLTLNEFVIRACLRRKITPMSHEKKVLLAAVNKTFIKIGNNINQLARIANSQKSIDSVSADLAQIAKEIDELWQFLKSDMKENQ